MKKAGSKIWMIAFIILLFAVSTVFIYNIFFQKARFTGKDRSIAVLPFLNQSGDTSKEYFNDGMTDEIISQLSKIPRLKVIARSSVMGYKNKKINIKQIAEVLHVYAVLQGLVRESGNRINIHAMLTDINTGRVIWEEDYDRELKDIFSIQNEVAHLIADRLNTELSNSELENIAQRPTQNLEAYDQFLQGRYYWNKGTESSLRKAIIFFNQAIKLDSGYSKAYSGLADCYSALGYSSYDLPADAFLKAEAAALKALQLDSGLADPHTSLGYIKFYYYWDWAGAEKEFLNAIQLNPSYVLAYDSYCYFLTAMERFPEARAAIEKAVQLDPLSAKIITDLGFYFYYSRNYDQAITSLKNALELNPKNGLAHIWLARCYQEKKMYQEAIEENKITIGINKNWPVGYAAIGYVYGIMGQTENSKKILDTMYALSGKRYVTPYGIALVYAGSKDIENTFKNLDKAVADRANWLVWLKLDPRWTVIRNDRRYDALIRKIGLPGSAREISKN
jgi:TolB-like protein/Tfp pilus assembly protein PilF